MKKVRRNAHKKIAAILDQITEVKVYSLDNGFTGEVIELNKEYLLDVLTRMHSSLMDNENGTYTIDVHSNLWYNLDTKVVETVEVIEEVEQTETVNDSNLIGRKVFGQWGVMAGWNYGVITDVNEYNEIVVNWEDWEGTGDGQGHIHEIKSLIIADENTNLDAIGIYLLPIEENKTSENVEVDTVNTVSETQNETVNATYQLNDEKQGVEIYFNDKPSEEIRNQMKAVGYRWGKFKKCWYAKQSKETIALAEQLAGEQTTNEPIEYSYPEIEIDDNDSYIINQSLQDREHDANWIFRQNKRDHNKELQELFTEYTNSVKEIISNIDNQYYIYKIKSSLQSFKKKYHQAYINWLSAKASQPHWAVSGRGNLSKSRYDKALNRQDKWMNELVNLPKELESKIDYYETKIVNEKAAAIREAVKNTNVELVFKTITKEGMRFYNYGDYTINKNWGTFRIYHNGKEVHAMRTTETLKDAKKYVAYLVQSQSIAI
jgi:hypothetical protein